MKLIMAIIKPFKLDSVREALTGMDVEGIVLAHNDQPVAGAGIWLTTGTGDWLGGSTPAAA